MWLQDLLWGFWNGLTAWIVFIIHIFGGWQNFPFYRQLSLACAYVFELPIHGSSVR